MSLDGIQTGDILAWEAVDDFGKAVCRFSKHWCCHVGLAARMQISGGPSTIWTFDMLRGVGGVATPLQVWVDRWPGKLHVYRVREEFKYSAHGAAIFFREHFLGQEYGERAVVRAALSTRWWARWLGLFRPNRDDQHVSENPPYCSHADAAAVQWGGGVDLVPNLAPESTWPRDVVNSRKLEGVLHGAR
jgi:hypothetical protein